MLVPVPARFSFDVGIFSSSTLLLIFSFVPLLIFRQTPNQVLHVRSRLPLSHCLLLLQSHMSPHWLSYLLQTPPSDNPILPAKSFPLQLLSPSAVGTSFPETSPQHLKDKDFQASVSLFHILTYSGLVKYFHLPFLTCSHNNSFKGSLSDSFPRHCIQQS